ncbi:uncharacterized protein [Haliotis cracherodii]|uniref:uncharacterized protein n=1 Tax=Haliotis cracherodii TaxID=6455 RepID=UPI0039ED3DFC
MITTERSGMLAIFLLGACIGSSLSSTVPVTIGNHWSGGFQGNFCMPFTVDVTSWKAHLQFDQPTTSLEIWLADIESQTSDGREYVLVNKPFNGAEHPGDKLCVTFLGHGTGDITPTANVVIENMPDPTTPIPTSPPTTTPTTPSTTVTFPPGYTGTRTPPTTEGTTQTIQEGFNIVTAPAGGEAIKADMKVANDWGNRFEAEFDFPLTQDVEGWEAVVTFNQPITKLDLQHARVFKQSADGKTWVLINMMDSEFYDKGTTLKLRFFGNHQGSDKVSGSATFFNMGVDKNGVAKRRNTDGTKYNYDDVLYKSILFYEAQRSGKLPASNRIPWRGDSALGDKGANGEDLTGGWYDAGDHVKFNFPMAYSTTILTWSLIHWRNAYEASGQLDNMYDCIKWPLDYLLKCHTGKDELYVQVGDGNTDHNFWGRPEDMTMARPSYKIDASKPGSDVAGETAAAMAAGSIAFKTKDPAYSQKLLSHATDLYNFAMKHKGKYSSSVGAASSFYPSTNTTDEHAWAGLWMYMATNNSQYLTDAQQFYQDGACWGMSWDDKQAANQFLFYKLLGDDKYKQDIEDTFQHYWFPGQVIKYTPKGLAWRLEWGSLRYVSNMALVALMAADEGLYPDEYRKWAVSQIHYALGDTGFSYLIGFGDTDFPHSPHHRSSSCPWAPAPCGPFVMSSHKQNVHTLFGALVGGPDGSDGYKDDRSNYVNNEVACDYNAGFQAAVAGLKSLVVRKLHPEQTSGGSA